ncbi:hypothetical protein [Methanocaldococcus villosus]|uniref:hypothetical protein n=1 Tax=Methanocaldococcus villosus TaxID=667126 RepID=UPI0003687B83|nr:hypothetical protein [Methanocaldococcus villosus]
MLFKGEKKIKVKIGNYMLEGIKLEEENKLYEFFNLALNKLRYRKAIFNNFLLSEIKNINRLQKIHEIDEYFLKLLDELNKEINLMSLSKGIIFELFICYSFFILFSDIEVMRNLNVYYNNRHFTEIDMLLNGKNRIVGECKNRAIFANDILKLFGLITTLNADFGLLISSKKFNIIKKEEVFYEYNIYILDNLFEKDKNKIYKEVKSLVC